MDYTYNYDESIDNNLTRVTLPNGTIQNIRLDKLGRTKEIINGDFTKQYSYLTKGNHTSNIVSCERFGLNGVSTDNIRYSYDEKGNITEVRENGVLVNRYTYDSLSRLIREDNKHLNKTTTYEYDAGGNILHKVEYNYTLVDNLDYEQGNVINYTYPINGWKDKMLSYNGETCEYDELGNPTTYRNHNLGWDYGRRLMSYGDNISYTYNANGIRHTKTVDGITTHFFTKGTQILGQYDGNLMLFYYGVDGITGFKYEDNEYTYKKNILGDIIGIYDANCQEIVRYSYNAWGKAKVEYYDETTQSFKETIKSYFDEESSLNEMIAIVNPIRYRGYYYDYETELYYLNSRYYDSETGRFINADDVSCLDTNNINGLNLYMYCANNPINNVDTTGYAWWNKTWKKLKNWVGEHITEIVVGTLFIVGGALVTALTAGAGTTFWAAFGSALLTSSIQVGLSITTNVLVNGMTNVINGNNFFDDVGNSIANGFMWGGIFSGGAQMVSGMFRILKASKLGFNGISNKKFALLSPDKLYYKQAGMTVFRIGNPKGIYISFDLGRYGIHAHLLNKLHIPIIPFISGIIELFN